MLEGKPLGSFTEYRTWKEKNRLRSFLIADGSPDGFFQLAVFDRLAGQFYLYWHANYNDLRLLTTPAEIEELISEVEGEDFGAKFTAAQTAGLRTIESAPTVEVLDEQASVTYCIFTKWGGLARLKDSYRRLPPHLLIGSELLSEVKYNCRVRY